MEQVDFVAMGHPKRNEDEHEFQRQDQDCAVQRQCPLFGLGLEELERLWDELKGKEVKYPQSLAMFEHHRQLTSSNRAILLSWLSEVCKVHHMHRETYYLSVELTDRFFLHSADIDITHLQLTGVTALMLAAKMEEIHPPKGYELADITDGACEWSEMRDFELYMSEKLSWTFTAPTPNTWLQFYLQIAAVRHHHATQTASPDRVSSPLKQNSRNTDADCDTSALEERTRTVQLAIADNAKQAVCESVCERVSPRAIAEEGCEGFCGKENFDCEKSERHENKENETKGKCCVDIVREEMYDKACPNICEKDEQRRLDCEEKLNLVNLYSAKDGGTECKNGEIDSNKQEERMLEDVKKMNIYDCDNAKDGVHDMKRTHLDPFDEEGCSKSQVETTDESLEIAEQMEDLRLEEDVEEHKFLEPLYSPDLYVKASQLMDLVILDGNSVRFRYSVLAAAVMFHSGCCDDVCQLTGLPATEVDPCVEWMQIHKTILETSSQGGSWGTPLQLDRQDAHAIQSCFVLQCMWQLVLKISDLYFASVEDRTAILTHIQLGYRL